MVMQHMGAGMHYWAPSSVTEQRWRTGALTIAEVSHCIVLTRSHTFQLHDVALGPPIQSTGRCRRSSTWPAKHLRSGSKVCQRTHKTFPSSGVHTSGTMSGQISVSTSDQANMRRIKRIHSMTMAIPPMTPVGTTCSRQIVAQSLWIWILYEHLAGQTPSMIPLHSW